MVVLSCRVHHVMGRPTSDQNSWMSAGTNTEPDTGEWASFVAPIGPILCSAPEGQQGSPRSIRTIMIPSALAPTLDWCW